MTEKYNPTDTVDKQDNQNEEVNNQDSAKKTQEQKDIAPTVTLPKKKTPDWVSNIKGFFKMLFVTPVVLIQNLMLRLAGGKDAVAKAQQEAADSITHENERHTNESESKYIANEINKEIQFRIKENPDYTKDGLTITSVKALPPEEHQKDMVYAFHVKCVDDSTKESAEYVIHVDNNKTLQAKMSVPADVVIQMEALIDYVQPKIRDTSISEMDIMDDFNREVNEANAMDETQKPHNTSVINNYKSKDCNFTIEATRTNDTVVIDIRNNDTKEPRRLQAELTNGCIAIKDIPDNLKELIAKTVYQCYTPLINSMINSAKPTCNNNYTEAAKKIYTDAANYMYNDVKESTLNINSVQDSGSEKLTNMYVIPQRDNEIVVVTQNINQSFQDKTKKDVFLHAYYMDVNENKGFEFIRAEDGKLALSSDTSINYDANNKRKILRDWMDNTMIRYGLEDLHLDADDIHLNTNVPEKSEQFNEFEGQEPCIKEEPRIEEEPDYNTDALEWDGDVFF